MRLGSGSGTAGHGDSQARCPVPDAETLLCISSRSSLNMSGLSLSGPAAMKGFRV